MQAAPLLVLKDLDSIYSSELALKRALSSTHLSWHAGLSLPPSREVEVHLLGHTISASQMDRLYNAADAYVSASLAEAFNLPLAEATAAGLVVIAPSGGAAEEVADSGSALFVASTLRRRTSKEGFVIQPEEGGVVEAMRRAMEEETIRAKVSCPIFRGFKARVHTLATCCFSGEIERSDVGRPPLLAFDRGRYTVGARSRPEI